MGKHKGWPDHLVYQDSLLTEMGPAMQSLQAPLFRMRGVGKCMSLPAISARLEVLAQQQEAMLMHQQASSAVQAQELSMNVLKDTSQALVKFLEFAIRQARVFHK